MTAAQAARRRCLVLPPALKGRCTPTRTRAGMGMGRAGTGGNGGARWGAAGEVTVCQCQQVGTVVTTTTVSVVVVTRYRLVDRHTNRAKQPARDAVTACSAHPKISMA